MTALDTPICRIIAGPNGAGKTTFALTYLRQFPDAQAFVNADLIAAGLSPLAPQQQLQAASRLMLAEIEGHIQVRRSFETTLSGRGYLRLIRRLERWGDSETYFFSSWPGAHHRGCHALYPTAGVGPMSTSLPQSVQNVLDALQQAITAELDRKARLGHYVAIWQDGQVVLLGPDAPTGSGDQATWNTAEAKT